MIHPHPYMVVGFSSKCLEESALDLPLCCVGTIKLYGYALLLRQPLWIQYMKGWPRPHSVLACKLWKPKPLNLPISLTVLIAEAPG